MNMGRILFIFSGEGAIMELSSGYGRNLPQRSIALSFITQIHCESLYHDCTVGFQITDAVTKMNPSTSICCCGWMGRTGNPTSMLPTGLRSVIRGLLWAGTPGRKRTAAALIGTDGEWER